MLRLLLLTLEIKRKLKNYKIIGNLAFFLLMEKRSSLKLCLNLFGNGRRLLRKSRQVRQIEGCGQNVRSAEKELLSRGN